MEFNDKKNVYIFNDDIAFRMCSLSDGRKLTKFGTCTNFNEQSNKYESIYTCNQYGVHLYCRKHLNVELENCYANEIVPYLKCAKCNKQIKFIDHKYIFSINDLLKECLKKLNYVKLNADNIIKLDDIYYPEKKLKIKTNSGYWISTEVKTDKDSDTIIVLYVGNSNEKYRNGKSQIFIQPEKLKLSHDHKDLDPATVISKIEVTLKDRKLKEEYDEN